MMLGRQALVDLVLEKMYCHAAQLGPGHRDCCVDHIYTNAPDKLIHATKLSKSIKQNIRYVKKRSYIYSEKISW